jgi:glycosyltransferase involved in cell wall biosynthesis
MKCSLIISVYNDIKTLILILEALKIQTEKEFEVIVADDGSDNDFVERLREYIEKSPYKITHLWHEDKGWRKEIILNKAVVASATDYLIFIDGDCIPHKRFIEEHLSLAKKGFAIGGRRVMLSEELTKKVTPQLIASGNLHTYLLPRILWQGITGKIRHAEEIIRITNKWLRKKLFKERLHDLLGCNFSIHKDDFLKINGFDERFAHPSVGEDTDIEARLNRIGIYCKVERHIITVYHKWHKLNHSGAENNAQYFQENNKKGISWTPYGIVKNKENAQ